jgi:Icc protein
MPPVVRRGSWQVVLLDSQIPGEVGGELGAAELALLEQLLAEGEQLGLYSLVCLHHQPVPIGCAWLDQQKVADAEALFAVLDRHSGVRGLLWGHVHQHFERQHGRVQLLCSPSTCVQFKPGQADFAVDDLAPGYRWLRLYPDGRLESGVSRVQGVHFTVDHEAGGYL